MCCINKLFNDGGSGPSGLLSMIVVLVGMGGQGKTQLALNLCRNAKKDDAAKAIFWFDSSSQNAAINSIHQMTAMIFDSGISR